MTEQPKVIILANGDFPFRGPALRCLEEADVRICCDGAADRLLEAGMQPDTIIGDLDSLSPACRETYRDRLIQLEDQESNDLTKAVRYASGAGFRHLTILGATGRREDHTLGNISLLLEYTQVAEVRLISDYGEFFPVNSGESVDSRAGEQFSIFSVDRRLKVRSEGLRFPLDDLELDLWFRASLNEALGESFRLFFDGPLPLIVYRCFDPR
jgi:thiamine pyrophosphokinase